MDPITIGIIISGIISGVTLILQFAQSMKVHNLQISSCMKTTNYNKKSFSSSDSSSSYHKVKKKRKKK